MTDIQQVVVDIETTGLDPQADHVLEIGMLALDKNLRPLSTIGIVISSHSIRRNVREMCSEVDHLREHGEITPQQRHFYGKSIVVDMHRKSMLFDEVLDERRCMQPHDAEAAILHWLDGLDVEAKSIPMTGSSVSFDRRFLEVHYPPIAAWFHRRNIDVSSLKELLPRVGFDRERLEASGPTPDKLHRAVVDCVDTVNELGYYLDVLDLDGALEREQGRS